MTSVENWILRADPAWLAVNEMTYGELLERAARAQVPSGVRVAIALAPTEEFAIALHAIWMRGSVAVPHDLRVPVSQRPPADFTIDSPLQYGDRLDVPPIELDAPALVLQTSGSSGAPKTVVPTFGNLLWSALGSAAALGLDPAERWLCTLPLSHVGGLSILIRSAIYGTTAIVHRRWDTAAAAAASPTLISLVPTTLKRLLDVGWTGGGSLRWALVGGAPLSPQLRERAAAAGVPVAETYGLTEACSQVTTFGTPLFCTYVRLAGDGEILVGGPTVVGGGELATGDLGEWTDDGLLAVVGRKSDLIISGGENVSPATVERVLESHDAVAEALVTGEADTDWGQIVVAAVVLATADTTEDQLKAFCRDQLAVYEVPKRIRFVTDLPRTSSGKLIRQAQ